MKKIAVFNHKGGVSKTTTTFNLGFALAREGKRVLLVDTDSQCNLTLYAMGFEKYEEYCFSENTNNLYDCLVPAYKSQPKLVEAAECFEVEDGLYLLPGSLNFAENEVQLGIALHLSDALGTMENLPGAMNALVLKTAEKYSIDYVLFDMNPSLSAINQDVFITSDYFIVPASPDYFSVMAIRSLSDVLVRWELWAVDARKALSEATYKIPDNTPKFLGYTVNDFNLSHGNPQRSFQKFMDDISDEITSVMIPSFREHNLMLLDDQYKKAYESMKNRFEKNNVNYNDEYCLARISNFNKLIALSNQQAKPIFDIDLSFAEEGQKRTLNWFKRLFPAMAERIVYLIENDESV